MKSVNKSAVSGSLDAYLGRAFKNLAKVSCGYYYSDERKKTGWDKISEVLAAPRFAFVIMDGNAPFSSSLFTEFEQAYKGVLSPDYEVVISDIKRVYQADDIISEYHLNDLNYEGDRAIENGDILVCIQLKRVGEAQIVMNLFDGIKEALNKSPCKELPFTYSTEIERRSYKLVFFSGEENKNVEDAIAAINDELSQQHWEVALLDGPTAVSGNLYSWTCSVKKSPW